MSQKKNTGWVEIKEDYMNHMPLKEICNKHDIAYNSLHSHIHRKKWRQERELMDQELFSVSHIIKLEEEKEKIKKIREKRYECCVKIYQGLADEIDRCLKYNPGNIDRLTELMKMFMEFSSKHEKLIQN